MIGTVGTPFEDKSYKGLLKLFFGKIYQLPILFRFDISYVTVYY